MKIPGSGEKPNITLLDSALNSSEAVKVHTRSTSQAPAQKESAVPVDNSNIEQGISVQFGLSKYLNQELDPEKIRLERLEKISQIKEKIASGTYLASVPSEELASKLLEEAQVEYLEAGNLAGNE